jgi:hypothetical protein
VTDVVEIDSRRRAEQVTTDEVWPQLKEQRKMSEMVKPTRPTIVRPHQKTHRCSLYYALDVPRGETLDARPVRAVIEVEHDEHGKEHEKREIDLREIGLFRGQNIFIDRGEGFYITDLYIRTNLCRTHSQIHDSIPAIAFNRHALNSGVLLDTAINTDVVLTIRNADAPTTKFEAEIAGKCILRADL